MTFIELAKKRYSVRKYQSKKVEKEKLELILEAGRVAPTGANRQPQRILVIQSEEGLAKVSKGAKTFGAPLVMIICGDHSEVWVRPYDNKDIVDIDTSIVTDHMMLQATELGLGSVWICYFKPEVIIEEFAIPPNLEPVNILAIGYSADEEPASPERHDTARKKLSETVSYI
ncbi:MAG: nitroreductase family protein [Desulfuromonadales bacterium]|nr:nitroreductase family protein [Desulfuromonadales bacterium]